MIPLDQADREGRARALAAIYRGNAFGRRPTLSPEEFTEKIIHLSARWLDPFWEAAQYAHWVAWHPRPPDLHPNTVWWGCCATAGGSPDSYVMPGRSVYVTCCPHCGRTIDKETEQVHQDRVIA